MLRAEQHKGHKAMMSAVLDTNVLWPSIQRNFLLSLADETAYRVLWSEVILDELEYEVEQKWSSSERWSADLSRQYAHMLRQTMEATFPEALVVGWEHLEGSFNLPDPNDEHVVAAAVHAKAHVIVTSNIKDFPRSKLPKTLVVLTPQNFIDKVVEHSPEMVFLALQRMSERSGRYGPVQTPLDIAQELSRRYGMEYVVALYS